MLNHDQIHVAIIMFKYACGLYAIGVGISSVLVILDWVETPVDRRNRRKLARPGFDQDGRRINNSSW